MFKNVASQKIAVFAWDGANGTAKTGDAANITAQISVDGGTSAATNDTNPTELDSTDHPGIYIFDLTQAETNGDMIVVSPSSATDNIVFRPSIVYTVPHPNDIWSATVNESSVGATPTTAKAKLQAIWNRLFTKLSVTSILETAYESDDSTEMETWDLSDDGTTSQRSR
jgi:hypothetical protein